MNWRHFQAFVWLRWRLMVNQWRRAGAVNAVLMMIVAVAALVAAIPLFIGSFALGLYAIPFAAPAYLMYAWDALIVVFLFFWGLGLLTELQRTEPLALSKFLHLPVSVNSAFMINYLSSLVRLSLVVFGPMMVAFCLALVSSKGTGLLPVLPSFVAFLLMITALTYQFQGWLASLMSNPRRRRTVIVIATTTFLLITQLPNLLNFLAPWGPIQASHEAARSNREAAELIRALQEITQEATELRRASRAPGFDAKVLERRREEVKQKQKRVQVLMQTQELAKRQARRKSIEGVEQTMRLVNMVLPIGWLPLGVACAAEGRVLPAFLGLLGMSAIGMASLWRAYRTTVGIYQGRATNRRVRPESPMAARPRARKPGSPFLEARLPGLPEPVSAVALASFRSLLRAPEAKMILLTTLIMGVVFGSVVFRGGAVIAQSFRPLIAIAGMAVVLLSVLQLMGNQFGFDRGGFRVFVLCAAPRRDILFGKNLAFVPLTLVMTVLLLTIVQIVCPLRLDHGLAVIPQYVSMFLLFCLFTNFVSIYAPVHVAAGSLKASNPKLMTVLLQLAIFTVLFPVIQGVTLMPLGIEAALNFVFPRAAGMPICLLLSLAECAAVVVLYHFALNWQGTLFQAREQTILESVTNRAP